MVSTPNSCEVTKMENQIEKFDFNLETLIEFSFFNVVKMGLELGIFRNTGKATTLEELLNSIDVPNRPYLKSLLSTYYDLGIIEVNENRVRNRKFLRTFLIKYDRLSDVIPEWIQLQDRIVEMATYAFSSFENPKVTMDFDKDADFWNTRLSNPLNNLYRKIIAKIGNLKDGIRVLDLGCGSVSPVELGRYVGPNGEYVGVDFSPRLLSIARRSIKTLGMDWVHLKEAEIRHIIPKRKYDVVIMSFVLEYIPEIYWTVAKALDFVDEGGKLIIVEPFRENFEHIAAWEFFEKLTKEFHRFPRKADIIDALEYSGKTARIREYGKSILVLELPY